MPEHLPPALLSRVADRFRVLGDETRLSILRTLLDADELNVGEIVDRLETTQANVSKHLKILLGAGMVWRRREGTSAYYGIADPTIANLCDIVCGRLRDQIEGQARLLRA